MSTYSKASAAPIARSQAPSQAILSQAQKSVAESTASQVDTKLRANQTKQKLKLLLKNIDIDKQGKVK